MNSELILAIDIGTSSTRTAFFDLCGERIASTMAQQPYPLITSADGGAEIDPPVLLGAVLHCLESSVRALRADPALRGRPIAGIGVSCFWHSLLGCDARGSAITRIFTWADSRCRDDAAELREKLSEKDTHARTGCMLRSSFWPAKLRWLRRVGQRKFSAVKLWMSPAEWLQTTLAGEANCSLAMASGTGLFNPTKLAWDEELLALGRISPTQLRPVSDAPTATGGLLATQFPELKGVPWFPGIGDGAASNLGSGATRPGIAAINVGTSAAVRVVRQGKAVRPPLGLSHYRLDAQRCLLVGAISNAGNLRAWCVREFNLANEAEIEAELARRPGPGHGLIVLPFWTTERAPVWNESDSGTIHGITLHTTALDLLQAVTEATYHRLARIVELIETVESTPPKFVVSGGIQRSPSAVQRLADVLGQTIYPNDEMEASLRGAAVFVLGQLGLPEPEAQIGRAVRPRGKFAKQYAAERDKQQALEDRGCALSDVRL